MFKGINEERIIDVLNLKEYSDEILNVYIYGSWIYGTNTSQSDIDIVIVVTTNVLAILKERELQNNKELIINEEFYNLHFAVQDYYDFTVYTIDLFKKLISNLILLPVECLSYCKQLNLFQQYIVKEKLKVELPTCSFIKNYYLNNDDDNNKRKELLITLRKSISGEVGRSVLKAKSRILKEKKIEKGIKCLYHCFRTLFYGFQIINFGFIKDFKEANFYYLDLQEFYEKEIEGKDFLNEKEVWKLLQDKYNPEIEKLLIKFKKLAPKE
ncbi:hypothetical protein ABK040_004765 [Willaertia magna]